MNSTPSPIQLRGSARHVVTALQALGRLSPLLSTRLAARAFFLTPPRLRVRPEAAAGMAQATEVFQVGAARAWRWGEAEGPVVLLQHGWGGRAAQLWPLVEALRQAGLTVVAVDSPAHGEAPGWQTSIPAMADALLRVAEVVGPVHAVISHSLGGPVVSLALRRGLAARRVVMISPPTDPGSWLRAWLALFAPTGDLQRRVQAEVEARVGATMAELHVAAQARGRPEPLLVVHDRDDGEVPWREGEAIARAWPCARMIPTEGLGHRRILSSPEVLRQVADFVAEDALCPACGEAPGEAEGGGLCLRCSLEREMRQPWRRHASQKRNTEAQRVSGNKRVHEDSPQRAAAL